MPARALPALLAAALLAGCASPPGDGSPDPGSAGDGPGESDGLRKGVVFFNQEYQAAAQDAAFEVGVPVGAVNVRFEVSQTGTNMGSAATITLAGCGSVRATWASSATQVGGNWVNGDLCPSAQTGTQALTLHPEGAPMAGRLLLRADMP